MNESQQWTELGQQLRVDAVRISGAAKSGHPTSSMSAADLMAVLVADHLRYDFDDPDNPTNDHLIFSKGHASPLLYAIYKAVGAVSDDELADVPPLRQPPRGPPHAGAPVGRRGHRLAGPGPAHRRRRRPGGQAARPAALPGVGALRRHGDGRGLDVGGVRGGAVLRASTTSCAIIDVNRLGQRGRPAWAGTLDTYADRARAFGWHAIEIDGHDVDAIDAAYAEAAATTGQPTVIVARTKKGKGVRRSRTSERPRQAAGRLARRPSRSWAATATSPVTVAQAAASGHAHELRAPSGDARRSPPTRWATRSPPARPTARPWPPSARPGGDVVALDGEVSNSTYAEIFRDAHPDRYFECYIAEQQMVATAVGLQVRGWVPFASTFAAFLTRAYDFVRMAAVSRAHICLVGSHAGVSIGEDGPSQMGLEDLASLPGRPRQHGALPVRRQPDGRSWWRPWPTSTASATCAPPGAPRPCSTGPTRASPSAAPRSCARPTTTPVTVVGARHHPARGPEGGRRPRRRGHRRPGRRRLLGQAHRRRRHPAAAARPPAAGSSWSRTTGPRAAWATPSPSVLADADVAARVVRLAVRGMPTSGKPDELLAAAGIDAAAIADAVRVLLK